MRGFKAGTILRMALVWGGFIVALLCAPKLSLAAAPSQVPASPAEPSGRVSSVTQSQTTSSSVPVYGFRIVRVYPHDPDAFTQGLLYDDGALYESTGLNGKSSLRQVELETGKVLKVRTIPPQYFAEGLALWHNELIQLTWRSRVGFVYRRDSFEPLREFTYASEGWGITSDGKSLIMSDGTATLHFLNPEDFKEERQLPVTDHGTPVPFLNELEFIKGEVFANIWRQDRIARISPQTGQILGWIDLSGLKEALGPVQRIDVLNGIAYDPTHDRIFVTGKWWPKLFEIELVRKEP